MSATLKITVVCDACGAIIGEAEARANAQGFAFALSELRLNARRKRNMLDHAPYKRTRHFCQPCADGAPVQANDQALRLAANEKDERKRDE